MTRATLATILRSLHQMLLAAQTEVSPLTTVEASILHAAADLLEVSARQLSTDLDDEEGDEEGEAEVPPAQVVLMALCDCSHALDELDDRTTFAGHRLAMYASVLAALDEDEANALQASASHICARLIQVLGDLPAPMELPDA